MKMNKGEIEMLELFISTSSIICISGSFNENLERIKKIINLLNDDSMVDIPISIVSVFFEGAITQLIYNLPTKKSIQDFDCIFELLEKMPRKPNVPNVTNAWRKIKIELDKENQEK